jgi:hypothetical protein
MEPQGKFKLHCFDETGQDKLFIVAVVVTAHDREKLAGRLEATERASGKCSLKWIRTHSAARLAYIQAVLASPTFRHTLYYSVYHGGTSYTALTVLSTAKAILSATATSERPQQQGDRSEARRNRRVHPSG